MAYLHCHTKNCNWSQDDFYHKGYNPLTKIWDDIKWLWKPRWMSMDKHFIGGIETYTRVPIYCGKRNQVHSWNWLIAELVKEFKNLLRQKWWTYDSWKKDWAKRTDNFPVCPKCGKQNFDID
jgi:hypothetical protein